MQEGDSRVCPHEGVSGRGECYVGDTQEAIQTAREYARLGAEETAGKV